MANRFAKFKKWRKEAQSIWDDSLLRSQRPLTGIQKFAHFWVLVWKSFTRNRCPVRASALAYVSLLALVPMLAVVMSVTSTFLKKEGEQEIDAFIVKLVSSIMPPATTGGTNMAPEAVAEPDTNAPGPNISNATADSSAPSITNNTAAIATHPAGANQTNQTTSIRSLATDERAVQVRK